MATYFPGDEKKRLKHMLVSNSSSFEKVNKKVIVTQPPGLSRNIAKYCLENKSPMECLLDGKLNKYLASIDSDNRTNNRSGVPIFYYSYNCTKFTIFACWKNKDLSIPRMIYFFANLLTASSRNDGKCSTSI